MKKGLFIICFTVFFSLFSLCISAENERTYPKTPDGVYDVLGENAEDFVLSGKDVSGVIKTTVLKITPSIKMPLFTLFSVLVLSALLHSVKDALFSSQSDAYELASCLVCTILVFGAVKESCVMTKTCLETMTAFMTSMLTVMYATFGSAGHIVSGANFASNVMLALQGISIISSYFVMPVSYSCFSLSLVSCLSDKPDVSAFISFFKKTVTVVLSAMGALISFLLSFQTVFLTGAETAVKKGVKFAAATFIPIVGSALSDASDAVFSSMETIKNTASLSALLVLLVIFLPCALILIVNKFSLSVCTFVSNLLSLQKQSKIFEGVNSLMSILLGVLFISTVVLMLACALFLKVRYA